MVGIFSTSRSNSIGSKHNVCSHCQAALLCCPTLLLRAPFPPFPPPPNLNQNADHPARIGRFCACSGLKASKYPPSSAARLYVGFTIGGQEVGIATPGCCIIPTQSALSESGITWRGHGKILEWDSKSAGPSDDHREKAPSSGPRLTRGTPFGACPGRHCASGFSEVGLGARCMCTACTACTSVYRFKSGVENVEEDTSAFAAPSARSNFSSRTRRLQREVSAPTTLANQIINHPYCSKAPSSTSYSYFYFLFLFITPGTTCHRSSLSALRLRRGDASMR